MTSNVGISADLIDKISYKLCSTSYPNSIYYFIYRIFRKEAFRERSLYISLFALHLPENCPKARVTFFQASTPLANIDSSLSLSHLSRPFQISKGLFQLNRHVYIATRMSKFHDRHGARAYIYAETHASADENTSVNCLFYL